MNNALIAKLKQAVLDYDQERTKTLTREAMEQNVDPLFVASELISVLNKIGEDFAQEKLFLPDLVGAAGAMQSAMPILESEIRKRGLERKKLGKVVIGTVFGDIHNIGKDMVATLMIAAGFDVRDLGINVKADDFVLAVRNQSPDILAMSSLLTTTANEQMKVIEELKKAGLRDRVKVLVGGGAINDQFAKHIGADGYEATAVDAVEYAKKLMMKRGA